MNEYNFPTLDNKVNAPTNTDSQYFSCLDILNGISRLTYRNVSVLDLSLNQFLYISENCYSVAGISPDDIISKGDGFLTEYVPQANLSYIQTARQAARYFYSRPEVNPSDYVLTFDFHIENAKTSFTSLIHHQFTPIQVAPDKSVRLLLCLTSMSPYPKMGTIEMAHKNNKELWTYDRQEMKWLLQPNVELKDIEKEVIRLSAQGFTISSIAKKLNKSFDTIKFYRKSIFKKLDVESITEAISVVISKKLL